MANVTPTFDSSAMCGGFMDMLFQNLPKVFGQSPKPLNILTMTPNGQTVQRAYLSIRDSMLYLHNQPLDTPAYTPENTYDLTAYNVQQVAALLSGFGGYNANASTQDGTNAALLLGFVDFPLNGQDSIQLQIATARLWKMLYPIARSLKVVSDARADALNAMSMPFSSGFWLDFWGDWFNTPRLLGMTDPQYAAYLLWNLRVPKVNNMAIEDILSTRYQVPAQVKDTGPHQFTAYVGMYASATTAEISSLLTQVKAAGVDFLVIYLAQYMDDYKSYLFNRYGWTNLDPMATYRAEATFRLSEIKYGSYGAGFLLNSSPLNSSTFGGGSKLKDGLSMH